MPDISPYKTTPPTSTSTKNQLTTLALISITILIAIFSSYKVWEISDNQSIKETIPYHSNVSPTKIHPTNREPDKHQIKNNTTLLTTIQPTPLPASLQGTDIDGNLQADENGHLIIDPQNKHLFDYFLSLLGEESQDQVLARITHYINRVLPEPAASQALTLFNDYLSLKQGLREFEQVFPAAKDTVNFNDKYLTQRLDALKQLRINQLGSEAADAFFSQSENYDRIQIEILRINRGEYDDDEKRRLALEAEAQLPQQLQQRRQYKRQLIETSKITNDLQKNGASAEELYVLRATHINAEFAERMAIVDQENNIWESRITHYQQQRQQILNNNGLADQDKLVSISDLRSNSFSDSEIKRVIAMDNTY